MINYNAALSHAALARMMPMHLHLDEKGTILGCGETFLKITRYPSVSGMNVFDILTFRRPGGITAIDVLKKVLGQRLFVTLRNNQAVEMRGLAMPDNVGGFLVNLSFGISLLEAVRLHNLTDTDFAPTDLAMEILYLSEAKNIIFQELKRLNNRLEGARSRAEEQALTDTLTGLRNRRALDLALASACRSRYSFGLMHLDLDRFKRVNDTLGHAAGDHVLRHVAQALHKETRTKDTVARVGGDEFVILLPDVIQREEMDAIAGRIINALSAPILFGDEPCNIGTSIGMMISLGQGRRDPDLLLRNADQALYEAKRAGRGCAVFLEH